jgi:hypothetical protein
MSVIISPPPVPQPADPASLTTYHQQLAAYCLALLDEVAAVIPRLEETMPTRASRGSGHLNIPTVFLGTAVDSVEQVPALQNMNGLDVHRGRATLQLLEAFRPIRDKAAAFDRALVRLLNAQRSSLTVEALDTYDLAKCLARVPSNTAVIPCVDNMQRALGRRGRAAKKT